MNAEQASIALGKSGGGESGDEPVKPSDSTERVQVPSDQSVAGRSEASVAIGRVTGRWKRTQQGSRP